MKVAGQWTHADREQIAHALNLPEEKIRVIYPAIGGAFGGREDMSVQIVLALATWRLSQRGIFRPVKIIWTREESIIGHHKRHAYILREKWGATRDGKVIAAEVEVYVADFIGQGVFLPAEVLSPRNVAIELGLNSRAIFHCRAGRAVPLAAKAATSRCYCGPTTWSMTTAAR